jgi:hypothetical protein
MSASGSLAPGDRVRIVAADSDYAGCRGTVAVPPSPVPPAPDGEPLGCYVTIDGDGGRVRPFLTAEIERLRAARVTPRPPDAGRGRVGGRDR